MKTIQQTVICVFLIIFSLQANAQKNFYKEAEKCYAQKEYYKASDLYKKAYEKAPKKLKPEILFKTGDCYRLINEPKQAEVYFAKCIKVHFDVEQPLAILYLADMEKMQEKYALALTDYKKYAVLVPSDPRGADGAASCELAVKWKGDPTRYLVENMVQINTNQWDYSPSYADKHYKTLIYSSTRNGIIGGKEDVNVGQLYADLFQTHIDNLGKWSIPVPLPSPINTDNNEAADVIAKKSNVMYFTRCEVEKNIDVKCKLYVSLKKGNIWDTPSVLPFCVDSFNFGHPAINPEENILVFSSDMAGGAGGLDLWYSQYDKRTKTWSKPQNLGPEINTGGDEAFPFIHDDGTLYFSSTGHLGMGGYDIFRSGKITASKWSKPENMRFPINSAGDDFGIIFEGKKEKGYLTSNRIGGKGGDDIYSFALPPIIICVEGYAKEKISKKLLKNATVKLLGNDGTSLTVRTDSNGYYKYMLEQGNSYLIDANGLDIRTKEAPDGYLGTEHSKLTTVDVTKSICFKQDFELTRIEPDLTMPMVLYNTAQWTLDHVSNPKDSLEYLYKVLIENPNITVELASHTDYRNGTAYNDTLSLKRARSCVEYLVSKGIAPDRMTAKGYGERKPLELKTEVITPSGKHIPKGTVLTESFTNKFKNNKDDLNYLLQLNRRTVFTVVKRDYVPHGKSDIPEEFQIKLDDTDTPEDQEQKQP